MPLDPNADLGRRAWLPCPNCANGDGCAACEQGHSCERHWQYLLANKATLLHLQCPDCTHLWSYDTRLNARKSA